MNKASLPQTQSQTLTRHANPPPLGSLRGVVSSFEVINEPALGFNGKRSGPRTHAQNETAAWFLILLAR